MSAWVYRVCVEMGLGLADYEWIECPDLATALRIAADAETAGITAHVHRTLAAKGEESKA